MELERWLKDLVQVTAVAAVALAQYAEHVRGLECRLDGGEALRHGLRVRVRAAGERPHRRRKLLLYGGRAGVVLRRCTMAYAGEPLWWVRLNDGEEAVFMASELDILEPRKTTLEPLAAATVD